MKKLIYFIAFLGLLSCKNNAQDNYKLLTEYKTKADSATAIAQQTLLGKVASSIKKGGTTYAVDFCAVEAMPITDSLSKHFQLKIGRISDKNRNPKNNLSTPTDKAAFALFSKDKTLIDTLLTIESPVYYKRINLAMPACLKCHGNPATDILPGTLQLIQEKYPKDLATNYQLNDLRGLWKVEFPKE